MKKPMDLIICVDEGNNQVYACTGPTRVVFKELKPWFEQQFAEIKAPTVVD